MPQRTAKLRSTFRRDLVEAIRDVLDVTYNLVLFKCTVCNERFPTFHPKHKPPGDMELKCLRRCPIEVAEWDPPEPSDDTPLPDLAAFHTGTCLRCRKQLDKVKTHQVLEGVSVFCAENGMDFVAGMNDDNITTPPRALGLTFDPLIGADENRIRQEYVYLFEHATVVEEMLVSLCHMQVDVCYYFSTGLAGIRKI